MNTLMANSAGHLPITNPGTAFAPNKLNVAIVTVLAQQIRRWRAERAQEEFLAAHQRRMEQHAKVQQQVDLMRMQNVKVEGEFKLREPIEGVAVTKELVEGNQGSDILNPAPVEAFYGGIVDVSGIAPTDQ